MAQKTDIEWTGRHLEPSGGLYQGGAGRKRFAHTF